MIEPAYLRFPHLHDDLVAFVAEDDVWLAPISGGRAWRVSADQVPAAGPRFSPDGAALAWTSTRDGAPEVHVAPVEGGPSERLTYWGHRTTKVADWTPGGDVVAVTAAREATSDRSWAHAVPLDGGPARRLPFGWVGDVAHGPDGVRAITSSYGRDPAWWKRYRGGSAAKLWLDLDGDAEFHRILPELTSSLTSPMWIGGRLAFLSDHDGVGGVHSVLPDGTDLRRHTEQEFYARAATTDGTRVVYQHAGDVWLLEALDAEPRRLDIRLGGPRNSRRPRHVHTGRNVEDVTPDKTGRASVVEVRGTVHWVTHKDGPARALAEQPGVRARLPRVVGESGQVVWVTDAEGEDGLEFAPVGGVEPGNTPRRVGVGQLGHVEELLVSPDGRRIAVATHDGRLLLVDVESGELREVVTGANPLVSDLAFSPDSNWLAWSHPGPKPLQNIRMANTTDLSTVDVTPLRFTDFSPAFTEDGRYLAFLSVRSFDPVYDAYVFDLSFPTGCRPYLLPLAATTPSPFDPYRLGRPIGDDDPSDKAKDGDDENPITVVDLEGLADRVVTIPVAAARYAQLTAAKGNLLWRRSPLVGVLGDNMASPDARPPRSVLERFDLAKLKAEVLVDGLDGYSVTGDGQRMVVADGATLRLVPTDRKVDSDDDSDCVDIDLSRVRVVVDRAAEWHQAYAEAGRLMRDNFWRTDMGGVDWQGVLDRYRPLVDRLGSHSDLVDLLWEVQGELGTSHAYVGGGGGYGGRSQGLLGADLERDDSGAWRIARIIPGETSDPAARSPLAAPGVAIRPGDALVGVDGRQVDPLTGPAPLLVGTAGKPVELTIRPGGGGEPRRVVVVPLDDDSALRYHAWVADRRARVHELSDGRVGYLHVPDMMGGGWAQLHRDLRVELQREAMVLDVRENSGGHTSELVVEKLGRRIIGWSVARGYTTSDSYPSEAPRGPVVAVTDEFAGSDGDIVNVAIKELGIGPIVGTRTWGGVIGIDSQYSLIDGTPVTQPRYASWFEGHGWGVENHGVDPDVEVVITPQDRVAGRDPQLDKAVELALAALVERPAAVPPRLPPLA
ncbi:S41 family peptidase [Umezawaea endophytica]|uniref:Tricorn protease homolog n=1 Tax=Umezawaea endophytica TaxID=1654476 RepID=A0A9X2VNS2_9PSEU|nr:S41 family peptidase [Umezawaea endophytica]MCS7479921.1 PDZ domain-containing protein [Umezawaea endophytica]